MAIPTVVAVGTVAATGAGAATPGLPAGHTTDDLLLIYVETSAAEAAPTVSGYAEAADSPVTSGTGTQQTRLSVFWKRDGGSESDPSTSAASNHIIARMIALRGVITTGDPWDVTAQSTQGNSPGTGVVIGGDTTTVADTLVLAACAVGLPDATGTAEFSSPANAALSSVNEEIDNTTSQGNGGGLLVISGGKAAAGAIGNTTATQATDTARACHVMALKPASGGTPATVTPSVIARSFTVPAPTVKGGAVTTPAAIARSFTVPAPTVKGSAVTTPAAIARSVTVPAVTVKGAAVVAPAAVARSFTIPQATASAGGGAATVTPATVAQAFTVPATTVKGSAVVAPSAIARSFTAPTTSQAGGAVATPAVIARSFTLPATTQKGAAVATPNVIVTTVTVPAVTISTVVATVFRWLEGAFRIAAQTGRLIVGRQEGNIK